MSAENGGPAFPHWDGPSGACFNGMTLRDYFAAKALGTLIAAVPLEQQMGSRKACAILAYEIADAMLAERSR